MSQINDIYDSLIYRDELLRTTESPIIYNPAYEIISCNNFLPLLGFPTTTIVESVVSEGKGKFIGYDSSNKEKYKIMYFRGDQANWDLWADNKGCMGAAIKTNNNLSTEYTFTMWINTGTYPNLINYFFGYSTNLQYHLNSRFDRNLNDIFFSTVNHWYLVGMFLHTINPNHQISVNLFCYDPKTKIFQQYSIGAVYNDNFTHYVFLCSPKRIANFSQNASNLGQVYNMRIFDKILTESEIKLLGDSPIIISK